MVLNGDVVSTGDIVNAGEIRFDNQTTPNAALSRAVAKGDSPVTFHKLTTSNLTGQGGTINMRVRLDGSNASDQLVINGGQATGKTWLAFTNVGNSNLGVATSGQGIRVVDAQNGATTEEGAFALSRPLQAGAFNYTLNRDSDEDWYCCLSDDVQSSCLSYGVLCHDGPLLPAAGLRPAASGMQRHYAHHRLNGGRDNAAAFLSARRNDARRAQSHSAGSENPGPPSS